VLRALVAAVLGMGRALKLCVVAEDAETQEQPETLRELNFDVGQGYLFAEPLSGDEMDGLVTNALLRQRSSRLDPAR
jgi:EAL domain-containing protein (putative c-di-GMP-specific phosphodiesterase class I)